MNLSERIAKLVVEEVLNGAIMHYRPDQSAGQHDFDLEYSDGRVVPLEVTVAADEQTLGSVAAIRDHRKGGSFVDAVVCQQSWYVHPHRDANINRIRAEVDSYLSRIEAAGITEFFARTDASESEVIRDILGDLGIEAGRVFKWKSPRKIGIALPFSGMHQVTSGAVQRVIETESGKADNRRKLGSSEQGESHLFVYVDTLNYPPWVAMVDEQPPAQPPRLPREISHVWAVAQTRSTGEYVLWRASARDGWSATPARMMISIENDGP